MYHYSVSLPPQLPCLIASMQSLTERYHAQKHLYDSDHGDRVGAQELLGIDDPVVKEVRT